jgi:acetolactate synthase I/II/III large subunit
MVKVSDVIVDFLLKNNIEVVFGIIGSANSHIYDSINKHPNIKLVPVHHEQVAVMAMGAYYRSSGKMAVALVTAGGGSSNSFTGILSNWADSIPGIIISGQEQSYYIDQYSDMRMYGIQGYDSVDTFSKHTKMSVRITKENVYQVFNDAFQTTQINRPGPVFLEVPFDVQGQMVEEQPIEGFEENTYPLLHNEIINIIELLNQSKKPVVIGGHGIKLSKSERLFKKFIEQYNLPTILTWSAVDLLEETHPNNYGRSGVQGQRSSNFIVQNCDLLIVMGSRLSLLQTGYSRTDFAPHAKIIHIDIDPTETNKFDGLSINKDIGAILFGLNEYSNEINIDIEDWKSYCDDIRNKYPRVMPEHLADPTNSYTFMDWFSNKVPDNYTIVTDMGTALLSGFYGFNIKPNQKMFTSLGLGEMGYGIAAAVGAGFGPNPVMCLNCDGGMMMNIQELQTIKTQNLPVKIVIFNNDGYLMIKHTQKMLFNGTKTCVDKKTGVELPDYKKVAKAFEYEYYTIDQVDEFLSSPNQGILEVFMDPNQEFIPKVKGIKNKDNTIQAGLLEEMSPLLPLDNIKEAMISGIHERSNTVER